VNNIDSRWNVTPANEKSPGNPGRGAREVPITEDSLKSLREIAEKAGFDVSKLLVAPWDKIREVEQDEKGQRANEAEPQKSP
jgi:hypothetical protein